MSERLSSVEIEDVLSSIRRLVSEDLRPGAKSEAGAKPAVPTQEQGNAPAPAAEAGPGKLVLTPAHRISAEAAAPDGAGAAFQTVRSSRLTPVPQPFAEDEDIDLPPPTRDEAPEWFRDPEGVDEGALTQTPADAQDEGEVLAGGHERDALASDLDAPFAEAGAEDAADWLPEDDATAGPVTDATDDAFAEEAGMPDPEEPAPAPAWARVEPETAAAEPEDDDWAEAAEAEIRRELERDAEASAFARFDAEEELHQTGEPLFDEEMLRDLVRDIIREELQGALGERITRNVRKLVRAEIARALAVRDFE